MVILSDYIQRKKSLHNEKRENAKRHNAETCNGEVCIIRI